jgi:hypothetical protein
MYSLSIILQDCRPEDWCSREILVSAVEQGSVGMSPLHALVLCWHHCEMARNGMKPRIRRMGTLGEVRR